MKEPGTRPGQDPPPATPFIHRHPWIILVCIFLVLIGAWTTMILIASKNRPEKVPLEHLAPQEQPREKEPPRHLPSLSA